jgi:integrase
MELLMDWQIASGRRIGETCKLLWEDWDREAQTIVVRKMKDPKNKNKRKVVALTDEAQAMLVELYEKRDPSEPRIFPYNSKSVGASYTRAKNDLEIIDLHLHDCRAKCYTTMREKGIRGRRGSPSW